MLTSIVLSQWKLKLDWPCTDSVAVVAYAQQTSVAIEHSVSYNTAMIKTIEEAQLSLHQLVGEYAGVGLTSVRGQPSFAVLVQKTLPVDLQIPTVWQGFHVDTHMGDVLANGTNVQD